MKQIYLLCLAVILAACSAEPVENEILTGLDANLSARQVNSQVIQDPMSFYSGPNKKGSFSTWNDCSNFYLQITPTGAAPDDVEVYLFETLPTLNNGENFNDPYDYDLTDAQDLHWTIPLSTLNTEADLFVFVKAWGFATGTPYGKSSYNLFQFDLSECGCKESFTYVDNGDMTYTFTYIPEEDIADAEMVFTFAQGTSVSGLETWYNNGKAQTWHLEENLTACQIYTWTVELKANCPGNTIENNVWTDFKVNDVSKKANPEDKFIQPCN